MDGGGAEWEGWEEWEEGDLGKATERTRFLMLFQAAKLRNG